MGKKVIDDTDKILDQIKKLQVKLSNVYAQARVIEAELDLLKNKVGMDYPIESLDLPLRVYNALKRVGFTNVSELLKEYRDKGDDGFLQVRNFGESALDALLQALRNKGMLLTGTNGIENFNGGQSGSIIPIDKDKGVSDDNIT